MVTRWLWGEVRVPCVVGFYRGREVALLDLGGLEAAFGAIMARVALELRHGMAGCLVWPVARPSSGL